LNQHFSTFSATSIFGINILRKYSLDIFDEYSSAFFYSQLYSNPESGRGLLCISPMNGHRQLDWLRTKSAMCGWLRGFRRVFQSMSASATGLQVLQWTRPESDPRPR
jgi:hypothetical protein